MSELAERGAAPLETSVPYRLQVYCPRHLQRQLRMIAAREGKTLRACVAELLELAIEAKMRIYGMSHD